MLGLFSERSTPLSAILELAAAARDYRHRTGKEPKSLHVSAGMAVRIAVELAETGNWGNRVVTPGLIYESILNRETSVLGLLIVITPHR